MIDAIVISQVLIIVLLVVLLVILVRKSREDNRSLSTVRQSPKGKNGEYLVSIENNRIYHVFFGTSLL